MQAFSINAFRLTTTACPLGDDPERSAKALHLEAPPELGTVAAPRRPLAFQYGQIDVQRAFAYPENIAPFAAQDAPDKTTAVAGSPDDFLDRHALPGDRHDGGVCILTPLVAFILQALSGGKQVGVEGHGSDGPADGTHRSANCIEKRATGIFHEMPAVGNLHRVRQCAGGSPSVAATAIACHDLDLRMLDKPRFCRCRFAIGQQSNRASSFKIADDRAVALIAGAMPSRRSRSP